jgi:hypothetical protein
MVKVEVSRLRRTTAIRGRGKAVEEIINIKVLQKGKIPNQNQSPKILQTNAVETHVSTKQWYTAVK